MLRVVPVIGRSGENDEETPPGDSLPLTKF